MNPQTALDAPRWQFLRGSTVSLEPNVNVDIAQTLIDKGHDVRSTKETFFGRGQIICKHNQLLYAASEPRGDGLAIASGTSEADRLVGIKVNLEYDMKNLEL
ncbi:MAG: gamma-glutamyltransferase [Cyanobacteria bacterium J06635_10]